jgi:hypothetical protein
MNKRTFILCWLIMAGFTCTTNAQKGNWDIGLEGGPGLSIIYADQSIYSHSSFSFGGIAGIFGEYGFARNFSAKAALHYERRGARIENNSILLPPGGMQQFNLDYLSVPLLVKWSIGRKIRFFVNAGPCVSLLLQQTLWYLPESGSKVKVVNETGAYSPIDLAMVAGIGLVVPVGKKFKVSLELRDNFGLINIRTSVSEFERDSYFSTGEVKGYTNSTLLLVGVSYRIGGGGQGLPCTSDDPDFQYIKK